MKPIRIYVAGPYTHPDPVTNTAEAIAAGDALASRGFIPYIPHLSLFWHLMHPHEYQFWCTYHLAWLDACEALLRLPGASPGADAEEARAHELGIPVFGNIVDLFRHFDQPEPWDEYCTEEESPVVFSADPRLIAVLNGEDGPDD